MSETKSLSKGVRQILETDIEEGPAVALLPIQAPVVNNPHDSAEVYSQLKNRHTKLVFPTLEEKDKSKGKTIIIVGIVAMSLFGAWGVAYGIQYALTPHVQGTCAPPAVIQSSGCFNVITSTGANGNQITTLVPAGTLHP